MKALSFFARLSFRKKFLIIGVSFALLVCCMLFLQSNKKDAYNTEKVRRADIVEFVDESGTVKVSGQTDIYSPTNGIIEEIFVNNGDSVIIGQELFRVVSTATEQEKQAAYASYLSAKATLDSALSTKYSLQADMFGRWDAFRNLATNDTFEDSDGKPKYDNRSLPEFHISEKEWLASEAKYKNQEQVIAQAQALTSSTWAQYQATQTTTVKSTANGVVANLSILPSDSVRSPTTLITTSGALTKPVLTIANFGTTSVLLSLGEADIGKVSPENDADITIPPLNNKKYKGMIKRVDDIGYEVKGVVKYDVFVEMLDPDNIVKSGMSADVVITTKKVKSVLAVPNTAVKPYKGGKAVQVIGKDNKPIFLPVSIGVKGEKMTQVVRGLSEGQEIITALTNDQTKRANPLGF